MSGSTDYDGMMDHRVCPNLWVLLLAALLPTAVNAAAPLAGFNTYANGRFGFRAEYPATWGDVETSANGDGVWVKEPNGAAKITMSGWRLDGDTTAKLFEAEMLDDPKRSKKVTYKVLQPHWYVVSGFEGESIFYRKVIVREAEDRQASFTVTFPKSRKAEFDSMIAAMSTALVFVELPWSESRAVSARAYFESHGEAVARQIQKVTHPTGSAARFGGVRVEVVDGDHLKVRVNSVWLGGVLRGEHTTTVLWDLSAAGHGQAIVEKDTANFGVAAPNLKELDRMFEALYPEISGQAAK